MTKKIPNRVQGFETRAIHAGYDPQDALGALIPPLHFSSTYTFASAEDAAATFAGEREQFVYGRVHNPTQALLETRLADLEGGEACVATASGMGAIASMIWSLLQPGDEVIVHCRMYGNSFTLFRHDLPALNIAVKFVDMCDPSNLAAQMSAATKMVFFESPANPQLEIIDISSISKIARGFGALVVVDNTFATPYLQRPLELGADLIVHSLTKYLCGHGDVLAGAVIGTKEMIKAIRMKGLRYMTGATISPMSAFLVLRGLKTLAVRMERHCRNALELSQKLEGHPKISAVFYPGLPSHPQHTLASTQMRAFGGLISLELVGGVAAGRSFMNNVTLAKLAVSLGDTETLIQHPASMTHAAYKDEDLCEFGLSSSMIRISVGLENIWDISNDLLDALDSMD